ncbi:MAG: TetR/AcrR family transcriptional regulator [Smithellaceae bacterium]
MELGSGERRKKEKENRRNAILKAARKLFFEKGFRAVTVDKIAANAEISKGTIYLYFNSKEEIYVQILIADNIEFHTRVSNVFQKDVSASELLLEFGKLYVDFFLYDKELFRIFMAFMIRADQTILTEEQNGNLLRTANDNIQLIAEILQKGINSGEFSPDINVRQGQNAIWGLLNGIISLYLFTGVPAERAKKIHTMVRDSLNIFIKGLKSPVPVPAVIGKAIS